MRTRIFLRKLPFSGKIFTQTTLRVSIFTHKCKKTHPKMRFFLLVYQYSADEVAELTDTFLAEDGIGFAAELGSMTFHHLLIPRMIRIFRYLRCLLTYRNPFLVLHLLGRRSRILLVIPLLLSVHLFRTIPEDTSVGILPCLTTHGYS